MGERERERRDKTEQKKIEKASQAMDVAWPVKGLRIRLSSLSQSPTLAVEQVGASVAVEDVIAAAAKDLVVAAHAEDDLRWDKAGSTHGSVEMQEVTLYATGRKKRREEKKTHVWARASIDGVSLVCLYGKI